jgi:hypothetical protein
VKLPSVLQTQKSVIIKIIKKKHGQIELTLFPPQPKVREKPNKMIALH